MSPCNLPGAQSCTRTRAVPSPLHLWTPFHQAAMVLRAQTRVKARLAASLRDGLRLSLDPTLVRQTGSAIGEGFRHNVIGLR